MGGLDHEVILVRLGGDVWVCDVGFGGQTPKAPVLLSEAALQEDRTVSKCKAFLSA